MASSGVRGLLVPKSGRQGYCDAAPVLHCSQLGSGYRCICKGATAAVSLAAKHVPPLALLASKQASCRA